MKLKDLTPTLRQKIAGQMAWASDAVLRHIQTGRRKASAEMAINIERAAKKVGIDLPRESLCDACGKCDLAKKARKTV